MQRFAVDWLYDPGTRENICSNLGAGGSDSEHTPMPLL